MSGVALQVANAKVLIPTTGHVTAQDINAATDLRLITNPAAGALQPLCPVSKQLRCVQLATPHLLNSIQVTCCAKTSVIETVQDTTT